MSDYKDVWGTAERALQYERESVPGRMVLWPPKLLDLASLKPDDRVLDVGCGTGVLTIAAYAISETVIGLDVNESMLTVAASKEPAIDWRIGDACDLPFDDGSFDVVLSQFALMFVDDPAKALGNMWRVLAPSGRLVVAVLATGKNNRAHEILADLVREHYGDEAVARYETPYAMGDEKSLKELATAAGIPRPTIRLLQGTATSPSLDKLVVGSVKKWVSDDPADDAKRAAMLAEAKELLAEYEEPSGEMKYPMNATVITATK